MTKGKTGQIMGMNFRLEQANIVGWLTRRETQAASKMDFAALLRQRTWRAPRITVAEIEEFLRELPHALISAKPITHRLLQQAIQDCQALLKPPAHQIRFMAKEQKALAFVDGEGMEVAAAPVDDELTAVPEELWTGLLKSAEVAQVLEPLREWFNVPFTFLLLQPRWDLDEAIARSPTWTLWLRCIDANAKTLDLLDPFPPLKLIAQARFDEPAALCWNWEGKALVVNLDEALAISSSGIPKEAFWKELQNRKLTDC